MDSKDKISLEFTEDMHGFYIKPQAQDIPYDDLGTYQFAYQEGEKSQAALKFRLTIAIDDIDQFVKDPKLRAKATGYVECDELGGRCAVEKGTFNLFVRSLNERERDIVKEMHYTLYFYDSNRKPYTFYGFKAIKEGEMTEGWDETTTLYTRVWQGHSETPSVVFAYGVLRLTASDFARQMTTFKSSGKTFSDRAHAMLRFAEVFAGNLWDAYEPKLFESEPEVWKRHLITVNSDEGVKDAERNIYEFATEDNLQLRLTRFKRSKSKDVVMLIHGLTTSTDMYVMPEHYNITQYLLDHGFEDVWSFDWRGSRRFPYNLKPHRYTIDHIALFDMPAALNKMREVLGPSVNIHVVCHCVGSIGFMCSLAAKKISGIKSIVSNSVSLKPMISTYGKFKIALAPGFVEYILRYAYLTPDFAYLPGPAQGKLLSKLVSLFHRECQEPSCHMISFMWGTGAPAAYVHKNISPVTHRRLTDLFGGTSVNYHRHIRKMVFSGAAVPMVDLQDPRFDLPENYLEAAAKGLPPTFLISGTENKVFPGSNKATYEALKELNPQLPIQFKGFPGYGHQDIYMGRKCAEEIFPSILEFLNQQKG
ncbi:alpha/beta fold hydrolase [Pseudobacteriovorax antillogorgiicola]|uniref:Triacylglycerol lipase/cholesterol oxidase n=1 Tax=Pseudobacteriovorax antillogorgiicola TaxID=1513793 RepID=A0A1Y6C9Y6_9BACT|nr:alpha/beta fold hydrolase [Pseudobacteriovorax antillogorgiicola]TCS49065.1 triacylglycerol lipase/cholesterol oxidase [Pseudobacteriovorax antillogorgiicola]SMF52295.1 triacylglycerol lipase/cholesterol oxidase [Pseudobacteriovorax antillogorgiicola]